MTVAVDRHGLAGLDLTCEFDVGGVFTVGVRGGRMTAGSGSASIDHTARVICAPTVFLAIAAGYQDFEEALGSDEAHVEGSAHAAASLLAVFTDTCSGYLRSAPMAAGQGHVRESSSTAPVPNPESSVNRSPAMDVVTVADRRR